MVFRLDTSLVGGAMSQKPGSNPSWVNPLLLGEERRRTDTQAGLALAEMIGQDRKFKIEADLKKQEFEAGGRRLAAQGQMEKEAAANKAANELFLAKQKFAADSALEDLKAENALVLESFKADAEMDRVREKTRADASQAAKDNWFDMFQSFMKNNTDLTVAEMGNVAASDRARLMGLGMAMDGITQVLAETGRSRRAESELSSEQAKEMAKRAEAWKGYGRLSGQGGVYEDQMGEMAEFMSLLTGKAGEKPTREQMIAEYQGLTGKTPPAQMTDSELANNIGLMLESESGILYERAHQTLQRASSDAAAVISLLSEFGITPETSKALGEAATGLLEAIDTYQGVDSSGNRSSAIRLDQNYAEIWRQLTEQIGTLPSAPANAPR